MPQFHKQQMLCTALFLLSYSPLFEHSLKSTGQTSKVWKELLMKNKIITERIEETVKQVAAKYFTSKECKYIIGLILLL
jgi:translation initiation factor 2 beta subunit (eIF-2beta)/eIF-5